MDCQHIGLSLGMFQIIHQFVKKMQKILMKVLISVSTKHKIISLLHCLTACLTLINYLKQTYSLPVWGYLTGICSTRRALLYLLFITYFSLILSDNNPSHYMASQENVLNQYFVKYAWGWTFLAGKTH